MAEIKRRAEKFDRYPMGRRWPVVAPISLVRLKAKALELGVPYQTLLASIAHRYDEGDLVERR